MSPKYHLIVDLEATCSNDSSLPREEMEIIEIGAVMVDAQTMEIVSEFQSFIRPVRHPQLTDFCKEMTSINQNDVDKAPGFLEVIENFQKWLSDFDNYDFCSWGYYDKNQLEKDCQFHGIPSPIQAVHRNLKVEFSEFLGIKKSYGMSKALARIGINLEGTHHRGIDDARNIAKIFKHIHNK
ncbi:MAG: exonuclease [Verrucomicrobia bacterium]|nr:MAG: exonuclease [Verrucomicrobiota bacterium]